MKENFNKSLNVLIVENSDVDRKMLLGMLSRGPYGAFHVFTAQSLVEAFKILDEQNVDVILLDLNLDDSNGIETLEKVHAQFPSMPIVVNTGAFQDDLGLKSVTIGAQDYLIKGMYKAYGLVKALYYAIERKRAETELTQALTNLQETQGQLIRVEKMNIVGSIASGVAHEVKNPLATILYGVEYLDATLKDRNEKIELTLQSMREATRKANNIIKDLLDFASLSDIKKAQHHIDQILERALNLTYHQCEKNNIQVVRDFSPDIPVLKIDGNRVEQVAVDLILNAILAIRRDGVLTVRTFVKDFQSSDVVNPGDVQNTIAPGTKVVVVDFEDTGCGIKNEDMGRIFDPFFTTRRARGGVGLGLSISRTIILSHGGIICVSNLPKRGARSRIIFPV